MTTGVATASRLTPAGGQHRAHGDLAFHVLDVMESVLRSTASGATVAVGSTVERPAAVPLTEPGPATR